MRTSDSGDAAVATGGALSSLRFGFRRTKFFQPSNRTRLSTSILPAGIFYSHGCRVILYPQKSPAIRVTPRKILLPASQVCTGDLYYVNTLNDLVPQARGGDLTGSGREKMGIPLILLLFEEAIIFYPLPLKFERNGNGLWRPKKVSRTASSRWYIAEPMGSESLLYLKAGTGNLIARIHGEHLFHLGEQVTVQLDLEKVSLFDVETDKVIR